MFRSALVLLVATGLSAVFACKGAPRDPVAALLHDLEAAAEARDSGALEKRLAPDLVGPNGQTRAALLDEARRYFALYEEVRLEIYSVEAQGTTHVAFQVDFTGNAKAIGGLSTLLPPEAAYRFECDLVEIEGQLEVVRVLWELVPFRDDLVGRGDSRQDTRSSRAGTFPAAAS